MTLLHCSLPLATSSPRDQLFDDGWLFLGDDIYGAEELTYDDSMWRKLNLPHDWSIEDLPPMDDDETEVLPAGPFNPTQSQGGHFTGYTVGGIGWYRKHFTIDESDKHIAVRFDGIYMNAEVWINGQHLGEHTHGYTAFEFDLTPYLNPPGYKNVLAVRVRNEGKNSRWYSGSGIYRHVYLTTTNPVHLSTWSVFITTPEVSRDKALANVSVEVQNDSTSHESATIHIRLRDANQHIVSVTKGDLRLLAKSMQTIELPLNVISPKLWSPNSPSLYTAEVQIVVVGKSVDTTSTTFGIRKIEFDAKRGFLLNDKPLLLNGGNMHHDNGPLGAAAIDRAEQRRVQLLKANGFNAIRCAHNPPSSAFLDACDRLGMLVIDEAFDQWNEPKEHRAESYHRFFKDYFAKDIAAMVRRDRNHPSVIMWSIGNEIPEQFRAPDTGKQLRDSVLKHDTTRPITQAICTDWGDVIKNWDERSTPAFLHLDVAGYNYLPDKYESDHARHPDRVMYGAESYPKDALHYWSLVEKHPYVIGDFVWSAMDYLGEAGLAHSVLSNEDNPFFMSWPWNNAWCGDLDICGFKKPQSYYRDVVWRRCQIEMFVHAPIPDGLSENISWWGWPNESKSWNWLGHENTPLQVSVYSHCDTVRLELNGQTIDEIPVSEATKLTATFDVPYQPGTLKAIGIIDGKTIAETELTTTDKPYTIRLTADRSTIEANRNDLSYITVEVVDEAGRRVPDSEINIRFSVTGEGKLAAQANGKPNEPASFQSSTCKTFRGRCIAILQPTGIEGQITLYAKAKDLLPASITIDCRELQHDIAKPSSIIINPTSTFTKEQLQPEHANH